MEKTKTRLPIADPCLLFFSDTASPCLIGRQRIMTLSSRKDGYIKSRSWTDPLNNNVSTDVDLTPNLLTNYPSASSWGDSLPLDRVLARWGLFVSRQVFYCVSKEPINCWLCAVTDSDFQPKHTITPQSKSSDIRFYANYKTVATHSGEHPPTHLYST